MANELNNPLDRMQSYYADFSKTDRDIYYFILNNPSIAATDTTDSLAHQIHVSKSALSRFSKRIGYPGFNEFRYDLSRFLVSRNMDDSTSEKSGLAAIVDKYSQYMMKMAEDCDEAQIKRIADRIAGAGRIKLFAVNRTYNSALHFKQRMGRMGYDAEAVSDNITMIDDANMLNKNDLAVFITIRNRIKYDSLVKTLYEKKCPIICITMSQDLSFRRYCSEYAVLPRISRDSRMSFLDDQPLFLVYIEAILSELGSL